jgi:hypothetical protein
VGYLVLRETEGESERARGGRASERASCGQGDLAFLHPTLFQSTPCSPSPIPYILRVEVGGGRRSDGEVRSILHVVSGARPLVRAKSVEGQKVDAIGTRLLI